MYNYYAILAVDIYTFIGLLELEVFGIFQFPPLGYGSSLSIKIMRLYASCLSLQTNSLPSQS